MSNKGEKNSDACASKVKKSKRLRQSLHELCDELYLIEQSKFNDDMAMLKRREEALSQLAGTAEEVEKERNEIELKKSHVVSHFEYVTITFSNLKGDSNIRKVIATIGQAFEEYEQRSKSKERVFGRTDKNYPA
jgi:hypothetical protein